MNLLLLILLIPLSYAQAPSCQKMGEIMAHYEKELLVKTVAPVEGSNICDERSLKSIIDTMKPTLPQREVLNEYGCQKLSTIEARIAKLENEQSLLTGFQKLKENLRSNKKQTAASDLKVAKRAGLDFISGLNTAKSLEVLLNTGDLVKQIKSVKPEERDTPEKLRARIKDACGDSKNGACDPKAFTPNQAAVEAINELLDNSDLRNNRTIESWREALKIKQQDSDEPYSFSRMEADLAHALKKIELGKLELTREELRVISKLKDFKSDNGLNLDAFKKDIKAYELLSESKFHFEDLKKRQEFEVMSKVGLVWHQLRDKGQLLSPQGATSCAQLMGNYQEALNCLSALNEMRLKHKDKISGDLESLLIDTTKAAEVSKTYLESLDATHGKCFSSPVSEEIKTSGELPAACSDSLKEIDLNLKAISTELPMLYALKDKIAAENQTHLKVRNFALDKYRAMNCAGVGTTTSAIMCADPTTGISGDAQVLFDTVQQLMIMTPDKANSKDFKVENIDELCQSGVEFLFKKELCAFGKETPQNKIINPNDLRQKETYQAQTTVESRNNPEREAWLRGLSTMAHQIANEYAQSKQRQMNTGFNPYMYNYTPYTGQPMMGISDQILFNARFYGGYGYYMPTMGYQPHTAFPTITTPYTPFAGSRSPYFTAR